MKLIIKKQKDKYFLPKVAGYQYLKFTGEQDSFDYQEKLLHFKVFTILYLKKSFFCYLFCFFYLDCF